MSGELLLGILIGMALTYMFMDLFGASKGGSVEARLSECTLKAVKADAISLVNSIPSADIIAAIKQGIDPLLEAERRRQLESVPKGMPGGPEGL